MRVIEQLGFSLPSFDSTETDTANARAFLESSPADQLLSVKAGYIPPGSLPADLKALVLAAMKRISVGDTTPVQYMHDVPDAVQRSSVEAGYIPGTQLRIDPSVMAFVPGTSVRVKDIPSVRKAAVAAALTTGGAQQIEDVATQSQVLTKAGIPTWAWVVGGVAVVGVAVYFGRK